MVEKNINVYPELCTGCSQCEQYCSFKHEKAYSPALSRIKVVKFEERCLSIPVTCANCKKPLCVEACPVDAIVFDSAAGIVKVVEDLCIGCKKCVKACPVGAVDIHPEKGTAIKCDYCGGDPECVKYCPTNALRFDTQHKYVKDKLRSQVKKNLE